MKILMTGGHFSPAYAIIQELQKSQDDVIVVGRQHPFEGDSSSLSYEYRVSKELNIPFMELKTGRLQRRLTLHTIPSLFRFLQGLYSASAILKKTHPDVILTFGGYLALPIAIAAKLQGIPIVTHEQTQGLGLSNKIIAWMASSICVSFASTQPQLKRKHSVVTGNPLRQNIFAIEDTLSIPADLPVLYITGGSTGSHVINMMIKELVPLLVEKYVVIHQTGENEFNDYEVLQKEKSKLSTEHQARYILQKFIFPSQIGYIYNVATLVIGRSGANTVLELIAKNKPSLLIPLPHGQSGEQLKNAQLIEKIGLGKILVQDTLNPETLHTAINEMIHDIEKYHVEQSIIDTYVFPDSARRIVAELTVQYEKTQNKKK